MKKLKTSIFALAVTSLRGYILNCVENTTTKEN